MLAPFAQTQTPFGKKSAPPSDSATTTAFLPVQPSVPQAAQSAPTGGNDTAAGLDYMYNHKAQDGSTAKQVQDANLYGCDSM